MARAERNLLLAIWLILLVVMACAITLIAIGNELLGAIALAGVLAGLIGTMKFRRAASAIRRHS